MEISSKHPATAAAERAGVKPGATVEWRREMYRVRFANRPIDTGRVLSVEDGMATVERADTGQIVRGPWVGFTVKS